MGYNVIFNWYRIRKISGSIKNRGKWSDILDEMFPKIAVLTTGLGVLQNTLSITVLIFLRTQVGIKISGRGELEARSSRKVFL